MNYLELINEGLKLNYYKVINLIEEYDIFTNPNSFIQDYFKSGGKIGLLLVEGLPLLNDPKRATHMCTLYALGSYLIVHTTLEDKIMYTYDHIIPETLNNKYNHNALYYWYLASLYHDIGYNNSEHELRYDLFSYKTSIRKFINDFKEWGVNTEIEGVFNKYFDDRFDETLKIRKSIKEPYHMYYNRYEYNPYILNSYYPPSIYKRYYQCRNVELAGNLNERFEHGIYGGRIFFNNILETMINSLYSYSVIGNQYLLDESQSLVWFPEQLDIFKDIALTISTHNIWKPAFKKYGIKSNFRRVNNNNPMLYLLCVCDNIDPYKYLMNSNLTIEIIKEILKDIEITFEGDVITIKSNRKEMIEYFEKTKKSLEEYVDVKCIYHYALGFHKIEIYL